MKNWKKIVSISLLVLMATLLVACGGGAGGVTKPKKGSAQTIKFWGWGDNSEVIVFTRIVEEFNKKYEGVYFVDYVQRPSSNYNESLLTTLSGSKGPDVFYVNDNAFKQYATLGFLADITDYVKNSTVLVESDMFPNTMSRYRYNTKTTTSNDDDPQYAVPKDLAPTGLYYNVTQFKKAGVNIISLSEEEALAQGYTIKGYDSATKTFNNKIAMSWSDCVELSELLMSTGASPYGFYSEWWFNYGWSVGGNCVEYIKTPGLNDFPIDDSYNAGRYRFTLNDSTKNYIVKDDFTGTMTINGNEYKAGEIISYVDKFSITNEQKANMNELPSQREAFTEFVRLSQKKGSLIDNVNGVYESTSDFYGADSNGNIYGYGITPNPTTISADGKVGYFTSGKLGMLVTTMSAVKQITTNMKDEWNVAPLMVYKEYSKDGKSVLVHGIEAAHSGSVAIAINSKSKVKDAAYLFAEYIASPEGQTIQADEGFAIPIQRTVANSEAYLNSRYNQGKNVQVFIDACAYETPGDWWLLRDKKWIDDWASLLNGDVRNGKLTLSGFYDARVFKETQSLLDEYTKR